MFALDELIDLKLTLLGKFQRILPAEDPNISSFFFEICILLQCSNYALGPCNVGNQSHQNHEQDSMKEKIALPRRRSAATAGTPDV
jgi:hypothetical protein